MDNLLQHSVFDSEENAREKATAFLKSIFDDKLMNTESLKNSINEIHKYENKSYLDILSKIERSIAGSYESAKKIDTVTKNLKAIEDILENTCDQWEQITKTLNLYGENLESIMNSKRNISMMLTNLNTYIGIQPQVEELKTLFENNDNIVYVYKQVRYISYLRNVILEKVKNVSRSEKLNNLADHLLCIQEFETIFLDKFWDYFANVIDLAIKKPAFLVKLLRLIDEDADYMKLIKSQYNLKNEKKGIRLIRKSEEHDKKSLKKTSWNTEEEKDDKITMEICLIQIDKAITDKLDAELGSKEDLQSIVDISLQLASDLKKVNKFVVPCFPPDYKIDELFKKRYIDYICEKIKKFLNEEELQAQPGNLIILAKWLDSFEGLLQEIQVDLGKIDLDVEYYMHVFYEHVHNILIENTTNILNRDSEDKANLSSKKPSDIVSYYSRDIFNCLHTVVTLLSGDLKGNILYQVVSIVIGKLKEIQQKQKESMENLEEEKDLILACVYVMDSDNCINDLPDFKKNIKSLLSEEYHPHIKNPLKTVSNLFNATAQSGCKKIIELMFIDIEKNLLRKLFTSDWTTDIVMGIFDTFGNYFNKGFCKLIKNETILTSIVRVFVDNFLNYYFDELIYTIRTINKKYVNDMTVFKYRFKYIKCSDNPDKKDDKKDDDKNNKEQILDKNDATQVKNLDKVLSSKGSWLKSPKKYTMTLKQMKDEDRKNFNQQDFIEKLTKDFRLFADFFDRFKEDSKDPFTKYYQCLLGDNYVGTYLNKFNTALEIIRCGEKALLELIKSNYKEYHHGTEGKILLEVLCSCRKDGKEYLKNQTKKKLINDIYDARIG